MSNLTTHKNVHSHIFTMDNAPEHFLRLFLPSFIAKGVDIATNTKLGVLVLSKIIEQFGKNGQRYAHFLRIGKSKDQLTVFEDLMRQYTDTMQIVALTLNMDYIGAGLSRSGFHGQVQQVIEIKKQYPKRLFIFLGIDPRWESSGTALRQTVQRFFDTKISLGQESIDPFIGLKLYPSTGYYVFDEKLKETFEWAADNGVPVLSHVSYLGGIFNYDKNFIIQNLNPFNSYTGKKYEGPAFINKRKWMSIRNHSTNCQNTCSYFLEPHTYESVLNFFEKKHKKLKICLAHFGGIEQMRAAIKGTDDPEQKAPYGMRPINWFTQIQELLRNYEGAYTDISYNVAEAANETDEFIFKAFLAETNKSYGEKIMFGTDFFLAERASREKNTYDKFKEFAGKNTLNNWGNTSFWDQVAKINTYNFLKSKYYP